MSLSVPARRIAAVVSPLLRFVEWMFSAELPVLHLFLGFLGLGWLVLMISHPEIFDQGNFVGMQWMPDRGWTVFIAGVTSVHFLALVRLEAHRLRTWSLLATSWFWLTITISLARIGPSTGIVAYGLVGLLSLFAAIYLSGRTRPGA